MALSRRQLREQIVQLLEAGEFPGLEKLAGRDERVAAILMQFFYDPGDLLQWRALEGLGYVAGSQPVQVRKIINRLLYLLNEDSASTGWGAAAALGEIGRGQISLIKEIIPMFIGFLEQDFSREPMLWGVGRLAAVHAELLDEVVPIIVPFLTSPVPQVRALAAWSLGKARYQPAADAIRDLEEDDHPVQLYDRGKLWRTTVGQVAREALAALV
ncbi:MAG: HEAT repeat domain-containing protein [Syntrophobacterales bacterium]|nr:HEAT repeat domain-containing protein [Syntrophobacterales bacterium]